MEISGSLEGRTRQLVSSKSGLEERPFMKGVGFYSEGRLIAGVVDDSLCVRVDPEIYEDRLQHSGVGPFLFAGRPVTGWLSIAAGPLDDDSLAMWIDLAESSWPGVEV